MKDEDFVVLIMNNYFKHGSLQDKTKDAKIKVSLST